MEGAVEQAHRLAELASSGPRPALNPASVSSAGGGSGSSVGDGPGQGGRVLAEAEEIALQQVDAP